MKAVALRLNDHAVPGWESCEPVDADLLVDNVPVEVGVDTVVRHADETAINLPVTLVHAPTVSYDLLGRARFINLYGLE